MRIDDAAVNEFLHTAYPRLVAAVALVCSSRPAAEDAVQEALLRAWERSEKGQEIEHLNAWVATVALNLARSGLRRVIAERKARTKLATAYQDGLGPSGDRVDVERALATLPRRQREAVVLRYTCRWTPARSRRSCTRAGTVKSTLFERAPRQPLSSAYPTSRGERPWPGLTTVSAKTWNAPPAPPTRAACTRT
jgi:RNA polymerase sigma-70 factor (ECF subfamily)